MTTVIHLRPEDLSAVLASHEKNMPRAIRDGLSMAAHRGRALLVRMSPVDMGVYKNSWRVRHSSNGLPDILNDAPHAGIVELGARPHHVSAEGIEALTAWVKRHIGTPTQGPHWQRPNYGPKLPSQPGPKMPRRAGASLPSVDKEARAMAWAIAKKIEKYGQVGYYVVERAMPQLARFAVQEVSRSVTKLINSGGGGNYRPGTSGGGSGGGSGSGSSGAPRARGANGRFTRRGP